MGYIYLICDNYNESYKIGMTTKKPEARLQELKTGNTNELFLISSYESKYHKAIETALHRRYKHLCENREWFKLTNDIIFNFIEICKQIEDTHIFLLKNNEFYN